MTLTNPQLRVLSALAQVRNPLSRKSIADRCFNGNQVNFAPILDPMVEAKLLTRDDLDLDGKIETTFEVTEEGAKLAETATPVAARATRTIDHDGILPQVGECFTKEYKGEEFLIEVTDQGFEILGRTFGSLTAAAKFLRGSDTEVNGWVFFGFK